MQPFNQLESAYTATAKTVALSGGSVNFDPDVLSNPERRIGNYGGIEANNQLFKRMVTL